MKIRNLAVVLLTLLAVCLCGIEKVMADSFPPMPEALEALDSDDNATVSEEKLAWTLFNPKYYVFEPKETEPKKGFIFYPGALVDPRSYAPPLHAIAAKGYLTIIVSMPFDLAPFGSNRANKILREYEGIEKWAIGGHSVGGTFACKYAKDFTDKVDGVIIWASFPSESLRIDDTNLKVICIYGTHNPNCNADEIEENKPFLPSNTIYEEIEGGNHTQFGYYDTSPDPVQPGDDNATITREEQQAIIIQSTVNFLDQL
jgi:hypothetical protein